MTVAEDEHQRGMRLQRERFGKMMTDAEYQALQQEQELIALEKEQVAVAEKLRAVRRRIAAAQKALAIAEADAAPLQLQAQSLHRRVHEETMARYAREEQARKATAPPAPPRRGRPRKAR